MRNEEAGAKTKSVNQHYNNTSALLSVCRLMVETKKKQDHKWERQDETNMIMAKLEAEIKGYICIAGEKKT